MNALGPNSACHCGSGRKYKKCCKRTDAVTAAANRSPQSGHVAKGPSRYLPGTSLDKSHPAYEAFEKLLLLDAAAGRVRIAQRDLGRSQLASAVAQFAAAAAACCSVTATLEVASPSFEAAAIDAVRRAELLAQNADSEESDDFVDEHFSAIETLNGHMVRATSGLLEQLGVDHIEVPEFGTYWFSNATLSLREGVRWLVVDLSIRLYPTTYAPGGLFAGRAALWGLSRLELDGGVRALLEHDEESDLDPEHFLVEILSDIANVVEVEGAQR